MLLFPYVIDNTNISAYRGKDSSYALEQNVGPTTAGDQESDWLYSQKISLRQLGKFPKTSKLNYSGNPLFLLQPFNGFSNEQSSVTVSFVSNDTTDFRSLSCEPDTGKTTELNVPFRKELPKTSLVSIAGLTRCVERNLCKMTQKITDDMHPHDKFAIQRFEDKLTRRGAKKPFFQSNTVSIGGKDKAGRVGAVSISGICALTVIADNEGG